MERKGFNSVEEAIEALDKIQNIDYSNVEGIDEITEREFYNNLMNNLIGTKNLQFTKEQRENYQKALRKKGLLTYSQWKQRQQNSDKQMTWKEAAELGTLDAPVNIFSNLVKSEETFKRVRSAINSGAIDSELWFKNNEKNIYEIKIQNDSFEKEEEIVLQPENIQEKIEAQVEEENPQVMFESEQEIGANVEAIVQGENLNPEGEVEGTEVQNNEGKAKKGVEKEMKTKAMKPYKKPSWFKKVGTYLAIGVTSLAAVFGVKKASEYAAQASDSNNAKNERENDVDNKDEKEYLDHLGLTGYFSEKLHEEHVNDLAKTVREEKEKETEKEEVKQEVKETNANKTYQQSDTNYMKTPDTHAEEYGAVNEAAVEEAKQAEIKVQEAEKAKKEAASKPIEIVVEEDTTESKPSNVSNNTEKKASNNKEKDVQNEPVKVVPSNQSTTKEPERVIVDDDGTVEVEIEQPTEAPIVKEEVTKQEVTQTESPEIEEKEEEKDDREVIDLGEIEF